MIVDFGRRHSLEIEFLEFQCCQVRIKSHENICTCDVDTRRLVCSLGIMLAVALADQPLSGRCCMTDGTSVGNQTTPTFPLERPSSRSNTSSFFSTAPTNRKQAVKKASQTQGPLSYRQQFCRLKRRRPTPVYSIRPSPLRHNCLFRKV